MKRIIFFLFFFVLVSTARSQELGYTTTDIGGEFQWHKNGSVYGLHLAFNSRLNSSFQVRVSYANIDRTDGKHDEENGSGWGGGLGYRYYFNPFPHKFFLGVRSDFWKMDIDWKGGITTGNTKLWVLQPAFEIGYLFYINDQVFITPSASAGAAVNLGTKGEEVGKGFTGMVGISAGVRF